MSWTSEHRAFIVSLTSDRYVHMLHNFQNAKLEELTDETEVWFQQDGAAAYTAKQPINALTNMFPSQAIFLRGDVGWPVRSPDLSLAITSGFMQRLRSASIDQQLSMD